MRWAPLPLVGRGWGWGWGRVERSRTQRLPPSPTLPHKGGGSRLSLPRGRRLSLNLSSVSRQPLALGGEDLRAFLQHVGLHPRQEPVAVARDRVPFLVIGVVAL